MKPPLVTCIVPSFNSRRYIKKTLKSIFAQTYRPIELVVADDGSTDGTVELVRNHGTAVRIVGQEHAGPASARNLGLKAAQGEFVAFLDADDLWNTKKLMRQYRRFLEDPEI